MQNTTNFDIPPYFLSTHAQVRMQQRGISRGQLEQVLRFGRIVRSHGGTSFHVLGRKEARRFEQVDAWLTAAEGVHLLVSKENVVITVYRTNELWKLRFMKQQKPYLN